MAASPDAVGRVDFNVEPDLQPIYPTPSQLAHLLSPNVGLSPAQKAELVAHCLTRACVFGDIALLQHLLADPQAQGFLDLAKQDEDGLSLVNVTILGFGSESDREVEREECVRLLISEGADVNLPDNGACGTAPCVIVSEGLRVNGLLTDTHANATFHCSGVGGASSRCARCAADACVPPVDAWGVATCAHTTAADCLGHRHCAVYDAREGRRRAAPGRGDARTRLDRRENGE